MKVRNEIKIGLITIVTLVLSYLGLNFLKGFNLFQPEHQYHVHLKNLNGAATATPVLISGYKVGVVQDIQFGYKSGEGYVADLTLGIDPEVQIPKGSMAQVKAGLISGSTLEIVVPLTDGAGYIPSGGMIPAQDSGDLMATLSTKVLPQVTEMLPQLDSTLRRLNAVAHHPAIDTLLVNLGRSSQQMRLAMAELSRTMRPMPTITQNVSQLTSSLVRVGQTVEGLPLDSLMRNLQGTSENLRYMSAQLKSQEGTIGKLLNDPALYNQLEALASSADALMQDIKANPKRYVHFSVFGRKATPAAAEAAVQ